MNPQRHWAGLIVGVSLASCVVLQPALRTWLASHQVAGYLLVLICMALVLFCYTRQRSIASASAILGAGLLIATASARQPTHAVQQELLPVASQGHQHDDGHLHSNSAVSSPSKPGEPGDLVNADTVFNVILLFDNKTDMQQIELFRESIIKRVYVQGCVRRLPCVSRLLRMFELGAQRSQVLAIDFMQETPIAERDALLMAIRNHPLAPRVFHQQSANRAVASAL
jgi:hypothetical protein